MAVKDSLTLYNSLSKQKERFAPLSDVVRIYSCGPTVYDRAHIGNFRSFLFADILVRTLKANGYKTNYIQNITDVGHLTDDGDEGEDKLEVAAAREHKSAWDLAKEYTNLFFKDSKELNLLKPDKQPHATDHIQEQIAMVKILLEKGFAYPSKDAIYFDTTKVLHYHKFDGEQEGPGHSRLLETGDKKHPHDFALWKFSAENAKRQMEWESPWGTGFPGWHIECSAMSYKYLDFPFDIHTGGIDHKSVHHTNEIAQNEAFFGEKTVNTWMHGEFVMIDGKKMSKSLGNTYTLETIKEKGFSPLSLRYLFLLTHYRQVLNFTWDALSAAAAAYTNIVESIQRLHAEEKNNKIGLLKKLLEKKEIKRYKREFLKKINDDLNTPQALALLSEITKNQTLSAQGRLTLIQFIDHILGLHLDDTPFIIPPEIIDLAERRKKMRKDGKYTQADELRKTIESKGFLIEDTSSGERILRKN